MTVSYQYEVASSTSGGFTRLLFMWKGSLYKLIYRELFLFLVSFGILSALYRNAFTYEQKKLFEKLVLYCDNFISLIPLSFVLGFYVAYVANRWWQQFMAIPWPDKTMHSLALYVNGNDDLGRMIRRTLMRYLNLSLILVLRSISSAVKKRLPTMEHLVEAGFMTPLELEMFLAVPNEEFNTYWIPCAWFVSLLKETRKNNRITDGHGVKIIMEEFNDFRSRCGLLWSYDWVSIPLVYTQVVTIATYSFFLAALVGRQYIGAAAGKKPLEMEIDIYLPVFTILQFFFFMGLLKVAEQLINPFGDDDEDFELNWLIDRHVKVSYLGVDILMDKTPPLVKDKYFDEANLTLPYTGAAFHYKRKTYRGSVHDMMVPEDQQTMFLPEIVEEDEEEMKANQTPKNSFPNIFTTSPPAGIWRQSSGNLDVERLAPLQESLQKEVEKRKSSPYPGGRKDKVYSSNELNNWESNSTVDSYCPEPEEEPEEPPSRPRRDSLAAGLFGRRSSGGTRAVRWRPLEAEGVGARGRRHSTAHCTAPAPRLRAPIRSNSECDRLGVPLPPAPALSTPSLQAEEDIVPPVEVATLSLPNIAVEPPDP